MSRKISNSLPEGMKRPEPPACPPSQEKFSDVIINIEKVKWCMEELKRQFKENECLRAEVERLKAGAPHLVSIPKSVEDAQAMARLGLHWLGCNAPDRLTDEGREWLSAAAVPDILRDQIQDAIADSLGDAMDCTRVWSAWSLGTMGPDDFSIIACDGERLAEIADAVCRVISAAPQPPTVQAVTAAEVFAAGSDSWEKPAAADGVSQ